METTRDLTLGHRVVVSVTGGAKVEGEVYTVDEATGTLILRRPAHENTTTSDLVTLINLAAVAKVEVKEAKPAAAGELPPVTQQDLQRREAKAETAAAQAFQSINASASPEAQQMFDMLSKTLPCTWDRDGIVVMQQSRVDPPYTVDTVTNIDGKTDEAAMTRLRRMVEDFSLKVTSQA